MPAVTGMGVDQDMAVICKDKKKNPLSEGLFVHRLQVRALRTWQGTIFSSQHPCIVYIRCNGFTEGYAPHFNGLTVKSVMCCVENPALSG